MRPVNDTTPTHCNTRRTLLKYIGCGIIGGTTGALSLPAQAKIAGVEPRALTLFNNHTSEMVDVVYWRDGQYDTTALGQINHVLRDHRENAATEMDLPLLELMHDLHQLVGGKGPMRIVSGFRTSKTNSSLRKNSTKVAKKSFHMKGQAVDIFVPNVSTQKLQQAAKSLRRGGVGYYARSGFIHIDTGPVRYW